MLNKNIISENILLFLFIILSGSMYAQEKEEDILDDRRIITAERENIVLTQKDALRPAKAAFFSAVLPGLGQAYNKDYWKIPIVYGALGTGAFFIIDNGSEFRRFRTALRNRIAGRPDEFTVFDDAGQAVEIFDLDGLIDAQDFFRRRRDLAILVTAGIYLLQVLEANVDAHLSQFSISEDLSLAPNIYIDDYQRGQINYGIRLSYRLGK